MKKTVTNLLVFLSFCFTLNATNGIPTNFKTLELINSNENYSFYNIFFFDNENEMLFIDFEVIADDLMMLNIWRDGKLMMEDDVTDLPNDAIYEINTNVIRKGTYTIELVTVRDIKIRKEIIVK
jgi:hypothetical protein